MYNHNMCIYIYTCHIQFGGTHTHTHPSTFPRWPVLDSTRNGAVYLAVLSLHLLQPLCLFPFASRSFLHYLCISSGFIVSFAVHWEHLAFYSLFSAVELKAYRDASMLHWYDTTQLRLLLPWVNDRDIWKLLTPKSK